jgi:hypothetical protein
LDAAEDAVAVAECAAEVEADCLGAAYPAEVAAAVSAAESRAQAEAEVDIEARPEEAAAAESVDRRRRPFAVTSVGPCRKSAPWEREAGRASVIDRELEIAPAGAVTDSRMPVIVCQTPAADPETAAIESTIGTTFGKTFTTTGTTVIGTDTGGKAPVIGISIRGLRGA